MLFTHKVARIRVSSEATSTRIRIFFNTQLFLSRFPHPHVAYSNRIPPIHTHSMVSEFTLEKSCLFGKRLDTMFLRHRIRKYPNSPSTRYQIRCGLFIFRSGERVQKYPDSLPNLPDSWGRGLTLNFSEIFQSIKVKGIFSSAIL